jgi:hypothetical protein
LEELHALFFGEFEGLLGFVEPVVELVGERVPAAPVRHHFLEHALDAAQLHRDVLPAVGDFSQELVNIGDFSLV